MTIKKLSKIKNVEALLVEAERRYDYQPALTRILDSQGTSITRLRLLEIILWKLNRYPEFSPKIITYLKRIQSGYSKKLAKEVLECLLDTKGVDLPMASTILRFTRPDKFQIIDQRVYRIITPKINQLKLPRDIQKKIEFYFEYLETLKKECKTYNIPFTKIDRILYQLDKTVNTSARIKV
jgi:hypothetical protein